MADAESTYTSNAAEVTTRVKAALERAAEIIGGMAESHAKEIITQNKNVDTGLLRNSITHGIEGGKTAISTYHANRPDSSGEIRQGAYGGTIPKSSGNGDNVVVVIGSNVEYAPYIELGTRSKAEGANGQGRRGGIAPHPFIRPAMENYKNQYLEVLKSELGALK